MFPSQVRCPVCGAQPESGCRQLASLPGGRLGWAQIPHHPARIERAAARG